MQMGNKDPERPRCLLAGRFHHQQHRHYAPHGNAGWLWPEEQDTCRATGPAAASSGAASAEELGPEIRFRVLASWAKAVINHRLLRTHRASRNTHQSRSSQGWDEDSARSDSLCAMLERTSATRAGSRGAETRGTGPVALP